ncbi:Z1 domain-containing protein [Myroides pelagicus]|nr:Z1 domain-containing protein [Myroides pelagicus]
MRRNVSYISENEIIPLNHKIDFKVKVLPEKMMEAVQVFIINIAVRNLRGYRNTHNSMLIHSSRFTDVHKQIEKYVNEYVYNLIVKIVDYGKLPLDGAEIQSEEIRQLKEVYNKKFNLLEFTWDIILKEICDYSSTGSGNEIKININVVGVYSKSEKELNYLDKATNVIVIGGASLSRGYTLEGLSVSYFLRNTIFYDTLMQMGRWFGYRSGYEDLCRIYMTEKKADEFEEILNVTEDLMFDFKLMSEKGMTPGDFGLAIEENPDSALQITAKNKLKNARALKK